MHMEKSNQKLDIDAILGDNARSCRCGMNHSSNVKEIIIQRSAVTQVPGIIRKHGGSRAFLIADKNTFHAAGETVCNHMEMENLSFSQFVFDKSPEPNEWAIGQVIMHYDTRCDFIVGVGSGTINDIGKMIARITGLPYMIVGTAPSMDGYASATSSVVRDGLKCSLNSVCPTVIIADLDIMSRAPIKLLQAGMGDMLAKYISICEWRLSHVINGEYYCEKVAAIVRSALKKCTSIDNLSDMKPESVRPIVEGLILSGIAMDLVGVSRPASGTEHYFSHIWDMRALEFKTPSDLHGIQCGVGTLLSLQIYQFIKNAVPNRQKALTYVRNFSLDTWNGFLTNFFGNGAQALIEQEKTEKKYDLASHQKRIDSIIKHWDDILQIISEELPDYEQVEQFMLKHGMPVTPADLGHPQAEVKDAFLATKDIRNKYISSRLLWDLGLLNEVI